MQIKGWSLTSILLLLPALSCTILRLPDCGKFDGAWTKFYSGKVLRKSKHSLVHHVTFEQCAVKCMFYPKCKSISVKDEEKMCMIHHSRHNENGTKLEMEKGWTHVETNDTLRNLGAYCQVNQPCQHGRCEDTCEPKQYKCQCDDHNWKPQATNVCFGAKGDSYGRFNFRDSGRLVKLKLTHRGEKLINCREGIKRTRWGCDINMEEIYVATTNEENNIFFPREPPTKTKTHYTLSGFNGNSTFLEFKSYNKSITVGEEFRIWYIQDLKKIRDGDNVGMSCADVSAIICD